MKSLVLAPAGTAVDMDTKQEIVNLPKALTETLAKGQPEYEALMRRTRWGEGPIYLLGSGASQYACLTGVHSFETLVGWPAVARSLAAFAAYSTALLRPGAVVITISPSSESAAMLEVARAAELRGATLLVLTNKPESAFAKIATGVLRLRAGSEGSGTMISEQAVMSYLGLLAARIFKKHQPQFEVLEKELRSLAKEIEGALVRMSDALSSVASELAGFGAVDVLGGGFYYPTALQAEHLLQEVGKSARAADPMELDSLDPLDQNRVFLVVSGSRCRARKRTHALLKRAANSGARIISVTDSNDRELTELSALAVLLPTFSEMVGAVLTSALIHWLIYQTAGYLRSPGQGKPRAARFGREA